MKIFSVGQVNNYIKNIISQDYMLKSITIRGEVSNCKYHSMGHIYFSLKDETGSLPAVMFKSNVASGLNFTMKEGQSVVVSGSIGVYERDGKYQLYANKITMDGAGKLFEEFERLKNKLNEEGLFDFEHKKPIPKYPRRVGIVTAKTGAAIQDIINIAKRRNPYVQLILYPAKVQGEGAAITIVNGIKALDNLGVDTIIVGRGGGSIEDLWAFNEEIVARAIYEAKTPIISGTGHEVDITLADYAADLRAPTPSAACELALPDVMSTINQLETYKRTLRNNIINKYNIAKYQYDKFYSKISMLSPERKLENQNQYLSELYDRIKRAMDNEIISVKDKLELYTVKINSLSPTAKLVNGFGYIESNNSAVNSVDDIKTGDDISIRIKDGIIDAKVSSVSKESI